MDITNKRSKQIKAEIASIQRIIDAVAAERGLRNASRRARRQATGRCGWHARQGHAHREIAWFRVKGTVK